MRVLTNAETDQVSGGFDLDGYRTSTNVSDQRTVSQLRAAVDVAVAAGQITAHEANLIMAAKIRSELARVL